MAIGDDQIDVGGSSSTQVLQQASPSILVLFGAGSQGEHLFVAFQIDTSCRQNDGGIGLVPMTNAEMHAIQVEDTPVFLQRTLTPGSKLLGERLVQTADCAADFEQRPSRFGLLLLLCGYSPQRQASG
jgi:hypothetical protein